MFLKLHRTLFWRGHSEQYQKLWNFIKHSSDELIQNSIRNRDYKFYIICI